MGAVRRSVLVQAVLVAVGVGCIAASIAIVLGARSSKGSSGDEFSKTWYLHTGDLPVPCFRAPRRYPIRAGGGETLVVLDLDGDGRPDVAGPEPEKGSVFVLTNTVRNGFERAAEFRAGKRPDYLAAGDLNGDLSPDLVTANGSGTVSVLLNNGAGSFGPPTDYAVGRSPRSTKIGDIDGDGSADVVVTNEVAPNYNSVLLNRGDGTFRTGAPLPMGRRLGALADLDGDGNVDLIALNDRNISVLLGHGEGRFAPAVRYPTGDGPTAATTGDLDGDGSADLVTANDGTGPMGVGFTVSVLLNKGDGTFRRAHDFRTAEYPTSVAIGDATGDGKPDIVNSDAETQNVSILINDGHARFRERLVYPPQERGGGAPSVSLADLDGDGEGDLVLNAWSSVSVLMNVPGPCHDTAPVE